MTLVIHAPNIHLGGGRTLLLGLLSALKQPAVVQLDERFGPLPELDPGVRVIRVVPSLIGRLLAEHRLKLLCQRGDILLCFGNLPPLFPCSSRVFVYVQNRYLTSSRSLDGLPGSVQLRIWIERLWLRYRLRDTILLVQTETMSQEVRENLGCAGVVLPFLPVSERRSFEQIPSQYDYLYVASGEPHKNHRRLLQAWILLASQDLLPSLCLTLDKQRDAVLFSWVEKLVSQHGLRIFNNPVSPDQISSLYSKCGALIYPSLFESYGLPLLEAHSVGMPIIAAERDYVRDVVDPIFSFDPESSLSIARAVMRYEGIAMAPTMPIDPTGFLERLKEFG